MTMEEMLELYRNDVRFIVNMAHQYPSFRVPSLYWRLPSMSVQDMEVHALNKARDRGYYEGIGVIGKRSYRFKKYTGSDHAFVTFKDGSKDPSYTNLMIPFSELYDTLETFVKGED